MEKKECPFCGELIQNGAIKCRYCREWLNEQNNAIEEDDEVPVPQESLLDSDNKGEEIILTIPTELITTIVSKEKKVEVEKETTDLQLHQEVLSFSHEEVEPTSMEAIEVEETVEDLQVEVISQRQPESERMKIGNIPTEQDVEEELIRWQNFKTNKILAIIAFILSCIGTYVSYFEFSDELTVRSAFWIITILALDTYLYYQLYLYLRNFDVFYELENTMKLLLICYIFALTTTVIFFALYHYTNVFWLIFPIISVLSLAVLWLVVGWKLWKRTDDFVGGLETFGLISFLSIFILGMGAISSLFLYKVFANAQEHIEENGYLDDSEDDY